MTFKEISEPVHPFNETGMLLAYMISEGVITFDEYLKMSDEYSERNRYMPLYEMAPRIFGEKWCEQHIISTFREFTKANKKTDPNYDGEYDLVLDGIRVEVKACRANAKGKGGMAERAYTHRKAFENGFTYHFEQLKPSCCDVFIWIGVHTDELLYWVLSSSDVESMRAFTSQHRIVNTGDNTIRTYEGQVFMTEETLSEYETDEANLVMTVRSKIE
ncbi:MAG: restriction endonuclease subunit M [Clostridia bacterium]|nr:restriction endonuclease subunit M [Clostridia bacterium]